jgi:rhamnosyltransferase
VGGTNPSLLEALGATDLNLLLHVGFNKEVAEDAALYWSKEEGNLAALIHRADRLSEEEITALGQKAKDRIRKNYSWEYIVDLYEALFLRRSS